MVVRELFAVFGIDYKDAGAKKAESSLDKLKAGAAKVATVFGGALAVGGFASFIRQQVELVSKLDDTSQRLGIANKTLQELGHAAQLNGISFDEMANGLRFLTRSASESATGSKELQESFKRIGVNVFDSTGKLKEVGALFPEVSDGIASLSSHADKVALSMRLFGRSGANLIPLLGAGSKKIAEYAKDLEDLGGLIGDDAIVKIAGLGDQFDRVGKAIDGLRILILVNVLPMVDQLIRGTIKIIRVFRDFQANTHMVKIVLIALGATMAAVGIAAAVAFAPVLVPLLAVFAAVLALGLIVEELIVTFQGGDTVIRRVIDGIFGVGATASGVKDLTKAFEFFWWLLQNVWVATKAVWAMLWGNFEPLKNMFSVLKEAAAEAFQFWKDQFSKLSDYVPDFVKTGFSAVKNFVTGDTPQTLPARGGPGATDNRTQVASVNVNVQSGADPHQIASEAGKAVNDALSRQNRTTMEALSQYAVAG
jgi:hypothetical protein